MNSCYRALSYPFRVRTDLPEVASPLGRLLAPFATDPEERLPTYTVFREVNEPRNFVVDLEGNREQTAVSARAVVDFVLWHVNAEAVKGTAIHLALHAGAVSRDGKAVILPAPPDSGKTTLTAGLVRAGFEYLSDEAAMIDPGSAWVHPFPRAMWMEQPTVELLGRMGGAVPALEHERYHYQVLAEDLRSGSRGRPCPVRFVIAPRYDPAGGTRLEPIARAEAVRMLAENSFNFSRFGAGGLEILGRLVAGAHCYRLRVDDLASGVETVSRVFATDDGGGAPSSARRTTPTVAAR